MSEGRRRGRWFYVMVLLASLYIMGCHSAGNQKERDTIRSGTLYISVDESFKPLIEEEIKVFESSYPDAHIIADYKPEAACLRDFGVDSVHMIIATRSYTESEKQYAIEKTKTEPSRMLLAWDAIAVVVNRSAPDSVFTMQDIRDILTGHFKKNLKPVFDGRSATSTVRYIVDSVLKGDSLSANVRAAKNSEDVLEYVSSHQDGIGFLGMEWIGNPEDTTQIRFLKLVRIAGLVNDTIPGKYFKPVPGHIRGLYYPMVRKLICVLKEPYTGLGHGFSYFLTGERGQLIVRRAYLIPGQMDFDVRKAVVNE